MSIQPLEGKMRLLTVLFIFVLGSSAIASNLDGVWTGNGKFESAAFGSISPALAKIEINQNGNILSTKNCWSFTTDVANWNVCSSQDLEISGSDLIYQGYHVGTISTNQLSLQYSYAGAQIEEFIELQANGLLSYRYKAVDSGGTVAAEASGLTK